MAVIRDDFVIAIRSAFLKKSYQQKFSLLTLLFLSVVIIILGSINFKPVQYVKIGINEIVYRSSFIISIPENYFKNLSIKLDEHLSLYDQFKKNETELKNLKEKKLNNNFLILENKKLRELINETLQSEDLYAKVLVDKNSPYLKSIILNKGSKDNVKIGMAIVDNSYLVGKVIEVNYTNSRALLLSDLNSKIPVLLEPLDIHAVVSGTGSNYGVIEYTKDDYDQKIKGKEIIVYTSGYGGLFKPGLPVGKLINDNKTNKNIVSFYSDFRQLDYVKIVSYDIGSGN
ncbi:rod shape-determining protein MreC [Candidatus Pelagibacter sp.]|jgi:rod shape-determining protein MreC|uniref:rod shape-determining protein MreC n=1 Tax=uncultured Candidatus Pelagibacter sp. TaxID=372654 RepID=UPI00233CF340|nr:rod shape-determining protein MreC [uncultured Candidatus Pelagibacter sp.]MDB3946798.1 rod shape-determining protein MreC [Candidatus Pelagibacter sp.]MDB4811879.1 rod shape-determining protein MreC [Candidatus Pelagibacter sp.]MDC0405291.1 rod shape-determining protein MreC [Candidatus Pelagibacter sp.]MDC0428237.1 rod shape-determining protein MreC [Candidatus Pelagibacter sp.]MDC0465371.1 rod shape-determining protein MreC [Candidatus Pelagibacter sp.]|tara:strand:- start:1629 stop:2486 length:858 start_codon:yes stop_codon:yes gene_type:complete